METKEIRIATEQKLVMLNALNLINIEDQSNYGERMMNIAAWSLRFNSSNDFKINKKIFKTHTHEKERKISFVCKVHRVRCLDATISPTT